jgi:hypothetical protein
LRDTPLEGVAKVLGVSVKALVSAPSPAPTPTPREALTDALLRAVPPPPQPPTRKIRQYDTSKAVRDMRREADRMTVMARQLRRTAKDLESHQLYERAN